MKETMILVGKVLSAQGIAGNIIVKSFTSPALNLIKMHLVKENEERIALKLTRQNAQGNLVCKIREINDRTGAEKLKGLKLFCYKSDLPALTEDEFYIEDLKGLLVVDLRLTPTGKITNVFNFGAGDIIEVELINSKKLELFPFSTQFFPTVTKKYIVLDQVNRI